MPDNPSPSAQKQQRKPSVIRSALSMAGGTFSSRIFGFVRDAVLLALFPRMVMDAFVVAFRLPNLFRRVLGEGSLGVSFIPVYVDSRTKSKEQAEQLSGAVFTILLALTTVIAVTCFVYMPQIIWLLVGDPHGFAAIPGKIAETIVLARIMIFYLILVASYSFFMAVANTLGYFFIPAIGPTLFNIALITFAIWPRSMGRVAGINLAYGVVVGGILQMGVVLWLLIKLGVMPRLTLRWGQREVARVFGNMLPGLLGLGVFQVITLVNTRFAAALAPGSQSCIYAADRILELPASLIAVSLGATLLPRFSELHSEGRRDHFLHEANAAVRALLYLSLPAAIGMAFLGRQITQVLFMRGQFTPTEAVWTAEVVQIYAVMLIFSSLSRVTAPAFYALKNTWLPGLIALAVLVQHIFLGRILVAHFGLRGIAITTACSAALNITLLQIFFHLMIGRLGFASIFKSMLRLIPALAALAAFCAFAFEPLREAFETFLRIGPSRALALFLVIGVGAAIYFTVSNLCRSPEAEKVIRILTRRWLKKRA